MMFGNRAKNAPTSFLPDATSGGDYAPVQAPPADPKSGGFFGEGGTGRAIAGYVGDYLAQLGGARPIYAPIAQQRQLIQQQQVKRQNDWEDFQREWNFQAAHPKAAQPTEFERTLLGAGIDPRGEQGRNLYAQRATTMASPQPQFISDGLGGGTWVTPPAPTASLSPQALGSELPAGWAIDEPVKPKINTSIPSGNPLEPWSPR